ncbi:MAG: replication initiator protein A [Blautia sp.]|uniref:DUF6017 domain-containing protein n=1 Tax=Blautia sp. TaxID=1955243 RepID=UPI00258A1993|nr:DUF6017 domain-containing protein [Blautia sp.]MCI7290488.1 replication initiator protein A [Blautia sp.]MCI7358934.1 replication initiator protein A [Parabacteroides sp.]
MSEKVTFSYFYGNDADQYSFYRIPKLLFTSEHFKHLSSDAKILYGLMLDRMALSIKNHWFDEKNRAYIYFSIEDIMELLNCGRNKAIKSLQELDDETGIGLVAKRRQGFGKANIIYVKSFMIVEATSDMHEDTIEKFDKTIYDEDTEKEKFINQTIEENVDDTEVYKTNFMKSQKQTSRSPENKLQEVYISNSNYTNINNTEFSDNESNHTISATEASTSVRLDYDMMDEMRVYEEIIKENISYGDLLVAHPLERETIEGIMQLILETVLNKNQTMLIASNTYPTALVKSKFLKLGYYHIEYVLGCLSNNTSKVKNIKKYLLAALFNAPSTMDSYYRAEVNHDMPYMAVAR